MNNASLTQSPPGEGYTNSLVWTLAALVVAVIGMLGSLWLSIGMGLKACPLCFYQRSFVMAVVGILATGFLTATRTSSLLRLLTLPAATGGLGVALFHVWLELSDALECPGGLFGLGNAPQQSLAVFALLSILLATTAVGRERSFGYPAILVAIALGAFFAVAAIKSSPPLPDAPDRPYDGAPVVCRPPYRQ